MDRIEGQRDRLWAALSACPSGHRYGQLHAALHALNWSVDPERFQSPESYISGIREDFPDCLADTRQAPLPDTAFPTVDAV